MSHIGIKSLDRIDGVGYRITGQHAAIIAPVASAILLVGAFGDILLPFLARLFGLWRMGDPQGTGDEAAAWNQFNDAFGDGSAEISQRGPAFRHPSPAPLYV
ncbi:hypothetical protein [Devosia sp. A449]